MESQTLDSELTFPYDDHDLGFNFDLTDSRDRTNRKDEKNVTNRHTDTNNYLSKSVNFAVIFYGRNMECQSHFKSCGVVSCFCLSSNYYFNYS